MESFPGIIDMRLKQLQFAMNEQKVDAAYISLLPNVKYLTRFSGTHAALIVTREKVHFFTDSRYQKQVNDELYDIPNMEIHITDDIWHYSREKKILKQFKTLGFEADVIPYSKTIEIRNRIRPVKFKPTPYLFEPFTQPKGEYEIEDIKKAADIAEQTFEKILETVQTRVTENELAIEISHIARTLGSQEMPQPVMVTSGERGNIIHGMPSDKNIRKNEPIMVNFATKYNGFCCELARSFTIGKATKQQQKAYARIIEAQELALKTVVPGMTGQYLDKVVRDFLKKAKYDKYFPHALGYGIGLNTHEHPFINPLAESEMIPDKTVLAISPGIYTERFGMRAQDLILVSVNGAERLTNPPKELPILDR
jgi:Xaa-Pro aminopeptidase